MKRKNQVPATTTKSLPKVDTSVYDRKIQKLCQKKAQAELYNLCIHGHNKYMVILGQQFGTQFYVCWSKNTDYNNQFEIANDTLVNEMLGSGAIYDYIFTSSELNELYNDIADRKLRAVAREATMSLSEVFKRFYMKK